MLVLCAGGYWTAGKKISFRNAPKWQILALNVLSSTVEISLYCSLWSVSCSTESIALCSIVIHLHLSLLQWRYWCAPHQFSQLKQPWKTFSLVLRGSFLSAKQPLMSIPLIACWIYFREGKRAGHFRWLTTCSTRLRCSNSTAQH
jgi:O-antigen ligase